jgi:hypothetical protein
VGALHQIWRKGLIHADFRAEQDRILAAILDTERDMDAEARPEFAMEDDMEPAELSEPAGSLSDLQRVTPSVPRPRGSGS